ncbi:hypothetical protein PIB30_087438, partial [Stylosanthes scabra]|nr:hypothetical protein [Stylosanthes scabra]
KLKRKLQELQNQDLSKQVQEDIKKIISQISHGCKKRSTGKKRSRLKWLKWGDKNTSFFHATTIQRKDKNKHRDTEIPE